MCSLGTFHTFGLLSRKTQSIVKQFGVTVVFHAAHYSYGSTTHLDSLNSSANRASVRGLATAYHYHFSPFICCDAGSLWGELPTVWHVPVEQQYLMSVGVEQVVLFEGQSQSPLRLVIHGCFEQPL
jgi:TPP-dependent trihydroxycyclohexane-1,2-dione (THcHDO) dehydratase